LHLETKSRPAAFSNNFDRLGLVLKSPKMHETEQDWLKGRATLGAATKWTNEEIRLTSELAYGLAEQGRTAEAIVLFEGLAVLAPATVYFDAALGALRLRANDPQRALRHLNVALKAEPRDAVSLVNRGEAFLLLGEKESARKDFQTAIAIFNRNEKTGTTAATPQTVIEEKCLLRAQALLLTAENPQIGDRNASEKLGLPAATD
jgi:Flp pilus assembly protein TadD